MSRIASKFSRAGKLASPLTRRAFMQTATLGGAGFLIGCGRSNEPASVGGAPAVVTDFNAFIRVSTDNIVTVIVKHLEMGQGVITGLASIVAEEMDADWTQMRWEFAPSNAAIYNNLKWGPLQGTFSSSSIENSWMQLREAAAAARAMLVQAAASRWEQPPGGLSTRSGEVYGLDGEHARFGELAARAALVELDAAPELKSPDAFHILGRYLPRLDGPGKNTGAAIYTIDHDLPGQRVALMARSPRFGGRAVAVDMKAALATPGVSEVVETPRGVAVLANGFWPAKKGRDALAIEWDFSGAERRSSGELMAVMKSLAEGPGLDARNDGDADAAFSAAAQVIEAEFELPYLAHAPIEPLNATVELTEGGAAIWAGSQTQTIDQTVAAGILNVPLDAIEINTLLAGGSFGRRSVPDADFVSEAVMIAAAATQKTPIKLQWTREDEMRGGRYRPMSFHKLSAALDEEGNITGWRHRIACQSIISGTMFEFLIAEGIDSTSVQGAAELPYAIENVQVDLHTVDIGVPVLWWRSVGHSHNALVTEVFFDMVARRAGNDPVEHRRTLLQDRPRHVRVLDQAVGRAGAPAAEAGCGRGVAVHEFSGTLVAQVADVRVSESGSLSVERIVCAVDCGIALNPDIIRAQIEGGIGLGLSALLGEEVTLTDGEVDQSNYSDYPALRISEMPNVDTIIVESSKHPSGIGEVAVPPIGPAVVNAIFDATGNWITRFPIKDQLKV